ncbi:MAG: HAMP domain-containing protein [Planctomycetes bacterium]|nr:HAMP domain-containing protein [Planctomycetota bacterium]
MMKNPGNLRLSLRVRVILSIVFLQVAGIAFFGTYQVTNEYGSLRERLKAASLVSARCIGHACMDPLVAGDPPRLKASLEMAKTQHGDEIQYVLVLDHKGSILAGVPTELLRQYISDTLTRNALTAPSPKIQEIPKKLGNLAPYASSAFEVVVPLRTERQPLGVLRLGISDKEIRSYIVGVIKRSLLMLGLAVGVGALLAFLVDRRLTQSFRELTRVSRKMASGDLSERVHITTGDDLENLGRAFNQMAEELGRVQGQLRSWATDLETKVRERTLDLEREKQKLSGIVDGIGAGLILLDKNLGILWINRTAARWCAPSENLIGRTCNGALWKEGKPCEVCPSRLAAGSGRITQSEKRVENSRGEKRYFQITSSPIKDPGGNIVQVLELVQDITQKKQTEAELLRVSKMAAIGEAASSIAHQINNPMAVIGANVERMQEILTKEPTGGDGERQKLLPYLKTVQKHVYRSRDTIEKILNFARVREPELELTECQTVVEEALCMVGEAAEEKGIALCAELNQAIPPFLSDGNLLIQVLVNLLTNAIDATNAGGTVRADTRITDGHIVISVSDTGKGIGQGEMEKILEPFYSTKTSGTGTGLGLSFCVKVLERLGGSLSVESEMGRGSTFTIRLPLRRESKKPDGAHHALQSEHPTG